VFGFSTWLFLSNLLQFVSLRAGDFIIGKLRGPHELGLFTMANEFGSLPTTELVAPINRAAFPGYSRLASDRPQLVQTYLRVIGIVALVALPAGVGISLTAPLFVPLLLGSQWIEAIPLLQLLALAGSLIALWTNTNYVLMALGKPRKMLLLAGVQAVATVVFLLVFLLLEVPYGAGWAMIAAALTVTAPNFYLWRVELGIARRMAFAALWRPAIACAVMTFAVLVLQHALRTLSPQLGEFPTLGASVAAGVAVYCAVVLGTWWLSGKPVGAESYALRAARSLMARIG
jgi:O-antigen/teichoic acid export membrane protein